MDAVFQDGVFKPVSRPNRVEGARVRITVESVQRAQPDVVLRLAARVYEGLSLKDIDEIEEMARRGPSFTGAHP